MASLQTSISIFVGLQRSGIQLISDFVRGHSWVGVKDTADVAAAARSCFGFPAK